MTLSIDPRFLDSLLVTWTGLVIVALMLLGGAFLVSRAGSLGITRGEAYRLYVISLLWGLVGARLLHVVDYAAFYWDSPLQVFYIWNGGFSAWGA
ncbi:MAG: prolipoprotein diacylglyceryl transferase family protein, partial [Dehalococcoidia bacterium]